MVEEWLQEGAILGLGEGRVLLGFGEARWASEPRIPSFYFPDFFLRGKTPWLVFKNYQTVRVEELIKTIPPSTKTSLEMQEPSFSLFSQFFADLQGEIRGKRLRKGVPYAFLEGKGTIDLGRALQGALSRPELFVYGFWKGGEGVIGATPEALFSLEDGQLRTVAIAGTMGAHHQSLEAFLHDPKERKEHEWVIEGIRASLTPYGEIQRGETYTAKAGPLVHLKTDLEGKMRGSVRELIEALHPTPALGAFPKELGGIFLAKIEEILPRGRFGAPVGALINGSARFCVAIRNVQWSGEAFRVGAGAGVVAESELTREWAEVKRKIGAIREVLGLD